MNASFFSAASWILLSLKDAFSRVRPQGERALGVILIVLMVLIDRASRELSNGCHIVIFDDLDCIGGNLDSEPDFKLMMTFLTRF